MSTSASLQGKVAIVTGGSRGIGYGIAQALLARGAAVAGSGLSEANLAAAKARLAGHLVLDFIGFRPQLFECVNCGREIVAEDQYFSFSAGGVICSRCGQGLPNLHNISVDILRYLRHFQRSSYREASRARPSSEVQKETESLMQGYFTYLLERELNTPGFLKRVRP